MCDVSVSSPLNGLATELACLNWFHALPLTLRKYTQARATAQTHRLLQLPFESILNILLLQRGTRSDADARPGRLPHLPRQPRRLPGLLPAKEAPDEPAGVILTLTIPVCALAYRFFRQSAWITDCSWVTSTGTASDSLALTVSRSSVSTTCKVHMHGTGLLSTVMS